MTDRFANGDPSNDTGGLEGDRLGTGFDPTDKGFFHGGDLRGIQDRLDYIRGLGTTAIWLTPVFVNKPVQGSPGAESAGYHGYWITDFTRIDPHVGSNEEMEELIAAAHDRGMKVFFDIVTNHTADVIAYEEGRYSYVDKATSPYVDAEGTPFDDKDYVGSEDFPTLDAATSFPHTLVWRDPADATVKAPGWLNDPTMYHNRGDSTFEGESSEYGDFFGLDDLFTERPEVVGGMSDIYRAWIRLGVDGFRIDTVKHVNIEFWQEFSRAMAGEARAAGNDDFFMFGEVYDARADVVSRYTTEAGLQATLDFGFQAAASSWLRSGSSRTLADLLAADDWFTDADSNVYSLPTFLGNHDMGRIAMMLKGLSRDEEVWLQRVMLGHSLLYLMRGQPVVYYGDEQGFVGGGGDKEARQSLFATEVEQYVQEEVLGGSPGSRDRYDEDHPVYRHIADLARLRDEHPALADGMIQGTYASDGPGVVAFSRVDRETDVEYVVALNNTTRPSTVTVGTLTPDTAYRTIWGEHAQVRSTAEHTMDLDVPALGAVVLRATRAVPQADTAPRGRFTVLGETAASASPRRRFEVEVDGRAPVEVAFQRRVDEGGWELVGIDDNRPYAVWDALPVGVDVAYRAVVRDLAGRTTLIDAGVLSSPQSTAGARVSAPGSFQDELGCTADWQPDCVVTTLTDDDGDGVFTWTTEDIPAGVVGAQDRPRPVLAGELRR
ncbi:MAG: alpha-amylase family glycosyl hydrolase [Dermatophilaceae bacterium]